jgi:hypothetical protein
MRLLASVMILKDRGALNKGPLGMFVRMLFYYELTFVDEI